MGLHVNIYRDGYDSPASVFHGKRSVTLVNVEGPFDPTDDAPAAVLEAGPMGNLVVRPVDAPTGMAGPMDGGTYAASSDSRFRRAVGFYGAVPVHDFYETWDAYNANFD